MSDGLELAIPAAELQALIALYNAGQLDALIERGERFAAQYPQSLNLYNLLGSTYGRLQRLDRAVDCFRKALQIKPDFAEAHNNLGTVLQAAGHADEAIACYQRALQIRPEFGQAHYSLGKALQAARRMDDAIRHYERAIEILPDFAEAHNNLGTVFQAVDRMNEAIGRYQRTLQIKPDFLEAHYNLGVALQDAGRLDEAIACYDRALAIMPDHSLTRARRLYQQANICDWDGVHADDGLIGTLGISGVAIEPFAMLSLDDDPERQRIRSERYAAEKFPLARAPAIDRPAAKPERIRIGYFSADFHDHATLYLMARLFELHDRGRFEVHVFSYGPDRDDDVMRQRLRRSVDMFHDVRSMGDREVAELACRQGIDIAIDLKGHTGNSRLEIFAWRPAPVQISYLGYPGTLGTPFIDYIVADRVVISEEQRQHYAEKIIYLTDSYQVNDNSRPISQHLITRAEAGLPDNGFVFCSFNNSYKISPAEFDIWMRLLQRVEGSVLWLFRANRWAEANLRVEAQKRGVDPGRLIFADHMPPADHLARHRLADLFLDTFNVNAHTTASDALWAGLPLVTKPGQSFAARVGASLLTAVGLPELITTTPDDYERLALELAQDPKRLAHIREKLASNRLTAPLFDTKRFTRQIEAAYAQAYEAWFAGRPPADIVIEQGALPEAEVQILMGLCNAGQLDEAVQRSERLVADYPQSFILHDLLGKATNRLGRLDRATDWFRKALQIAPDSAETYYNLGVTLQALGRMDEAIASYERAIAIKPDYAGAHNNLGSSLQALGRRNEAIPHHQRAIQIRPDYGLAHFNLGKALQVLGRLEDAIPHFERALEIRPDFVEALNNLGVSLQALGRLDEAVTYYRRVLQIMPNNTAACSQMLSQQGHMCDWEGSQSSAELTPALGVVGSSASPFIMLPFEDHPGRHRIRSEKHAKENYRPSALEGKVPPAVRPDRLRIGYFSADFHNHATMYLMARLFELHDHSRFEVRAYSYGPDRNDEMRRRLKSSVDAFRDVSQMGDREIAELARGDGIDIAVDLKGYTHGERLGIFAWRPAPIQISFLGYPGTLGAPFIDYIVSDRIVIPDAQRAHYSENIIYLPDSYQVNDDRRPISDRTITRAEMGLPENGLVFCSFNNSYKISPAEFDIWMRLLRQVEGSVLWLLKANRWAEANLRQEAQKRGIDGDRLIFADRMPLAEHLARHRLADLFLDTFNVNAHTTASDALWAGLPVLTKIGQGFAARVAGSLLSAVGLPELIATTSDDYERLALELAKDPQRLTKVKEKLAANRLTAPLFDTERFTRHIEAGYGQAYEAWFAGRPFADIMIEQGGGGPG